MNKKYIIAVTFCALVCKANAAWYWPFGSEKSNDDSISSLIEPITTLIDDAGDLAEDGKIDDAVAKYREAIKELDRLEANHPEKADSPEFSTIRTKRAYVTASIDSLLLAETRKNARAVAVTDTTELEKKYAKLKESKKTAKKPADPPTVSEDKNEELAATPDEASLRRDEIARMLSQDPRNRRARLLLVREDILAGDFQSARLALAQLLQEKPNDAAALNMRAFMEIRQNNHKEAEKTLDQCIRSNPRSHNAYYNLARLYLATRGASGKDAARRFYETGRKLGGKVDRALEMELK